MSRVNGKNRKELLAMAKVQGEGNKGWYAYLFFIFSYLSLVGTFMVDTSMIWSHYTSLGVSFYYLLIWILVT